MRNNITKKSVVVCETVATVKELSNKLNKDFPFKIGTTTRVARVEC